MGIVIFSFFSKFLPSLAWVERVGVFATVLGIASALFAGWLVALQHRVQGSGGRSGFRILVLLFFSLPFVYVLGSWPLYLGPPMVRAGLLGASVELPYVVQGYGVHDRKCPHPLELADMPFLLDKVCGLSAAAQEDFAKGDPVVVSGRGSVWGIFPRSVRKASQP